MKRRTYPAPRGGISPYQKYGKKPTSYRAMYQRCPWLRQPHEERVGSSGFGSLSRPEDTEDLDGNS